MAYPRGSEWRRWDLHVHTPYSVLNNEFKCNFNEYAIHLLNKAVELNIAALGITDYYTIEGYKELVSKIQDEEWLNDSFKTEVAQKIPEILILPNIEFRCNPLIQTADGRDRKPNLHVIFSNEVLPEDIEDNFLNQLNFSAQGNLGMPDDCWPLNPRYITTLGKKLKEQHEAFRSETDLFVGMKNLLIKHEDISSTLAQKATHFNNKYIIGVSADEDLSKIRWDGQGHQTRKVIIQKSHVLFSSNPETILFGLGKKSASPEEFEKEFSSRKACIHGSDAHDLKGLFKPDDDRFTWIKANPTFPGLLRLLKEPETRVFIGAEPEALTFQNKNKSKFCDTISIKKADGSQFTESWFDCTIALNQGLIAIIGNKGSGKSALADCLGLLGNSKKESYFSFLNAQKFRQPRVNKAKNFRAQLKWCNGVTESKLLSDNVDPTKVETIKYIPQNFLENICNEISEGRNLEFHKELKDVIFSHVPKKDRLGYLTLDDLIEFKSDQSQEKITELQKQLSAINSKILHYETILEPEHKATTEAQIARKRQELQDHESVKPATVPEPEKDSDVAAKQAELSIAIGAERKAIAELDQSITASNESIEQLTRRIAIIDKLFETLDGIAKHVKKHIDANDAFSELELDPDSIVQLTINTGPLTDAKTEASTNLDKEKRNLDPENPESSIAKHNHHSTILSALIQQMDAPNKDYQEYLDLVGKWEEDKKAIEGSTTTPDTLGFYIEQLRIIDNTPDDLATQIKARKETTQAIHQEITTLAKTYKKLYRPIEVALKTLQSTNETLLLGFNVKFTVTGFSDRFFSYIHQGRVGSFAGLDEGSRLLRQFLEECEFSSEDETIAFVEKTTNALRFLDGNTEKPIKLTEQLKKGAVASDLLDYIYGLSYLSPQFELTWGTRPLEYLSPGERCHPAEIMTHVIASSGCDNRPSSITR